MKKILVFILKCLLALLLLSVAQVVLLRWMPVVVTPVMAVRSIQHRGEDGYRTFRRWRKIEKISPDLVRTVIASEDNLFPTHRGFDWDAVKKEMERSRKTGTQPRGCSTISQQTAKNVFTFGDRSMLRKGVEAYYTFLIERIWGKKRIMEVYLNIAEMGYGVFGAEAAARTYYDKHASDLNIYESAMITACLPNPITRNPKSPSAGVRRRQGQIISLVPKLDFSFMEEW